MAHSNPFVDYLNSLHNGNAANQNAIGEMQISSPFFAATQVKRPLVDFIRDKVLCDEFVILTGHAGDGKTTLLSQVFDALGCHQETLCPVAELSVGSRTVHYVKDFSELTREQQDAELRTCFQRQGAAVLIANTGPLLAAFNRLGGRDWESELLDIMDQPAGGQVEAKGFGEAFLLNIARVDNTDFIRPYLRNLTDNANWTPCQTCPSRDICPVFFNQNILSERLERASDFIWKTYIWLQEYDRRVTIRQIAAHLTYAITGGLNCEIVAAHCAPSWRYRYLFSNLFFGCDGTRPMQNANQIRGIRLVNEIHLDMKPTCMDYDLFNKSDFDLYFPDNLARLFSQAFDRYRHCTNGRDQIILKRAFLFFGQGTKEQMDAQDKETFSEWFDIYLRIRFEGEKPREIYKKSICSALHTLFIGETIDSDTTRIDLTLRRNNEQTSNVQLLSGRIDTDNVALRCEAVDTIAGEKQYRLILDTGRVRYPITLPLLNYFCEIYRGIIITDIDPMLSNGIDSLKAQLLSEHMVAADDDEVRLVFLSGSRWQKRTLIIGEHSIDHD